MMSMQAIAWQNRGRGKRFTNYYDCAIAWAYRRADNGKAGRVFFQGPTIYSYGQHFPMAHIVDERPSAVIVNADSYSSSTGNHQRKVRSAISHAFSDGGVFYAPTEALKAWSGDYSDKDKALAHIHTLRYYADEARKSYAASIKARSRKSQHLADYTHYIRQMERYSEHFGVDLDTLLLSEALEGGQLAADLASAVKQAREAKQLTVEV